MRRTISDPVRLAPIGLGRWARVLARGAQRGTVIELASCFSRSPRVAPPSRRSSGYPGRQRPSTSCSPTRRSKGVIVTTPNDTHKAVILECLEAGKAVYTDKPIAHTLEDASRDRRRGGPHREGRSPSGTAPAVSPGTGR